MSATRERRKPEPTRRMSNARCRPGGRPPVNRRVLAVAAAFFVVGLVLSAWFTQIPQFKARLGLGDGILGLALFCPAAGALISMQAAGWLARKYGSAPLLRIASAAVGVTMLLVGAAPGFAWFAIGLVVFGLADGMCRRVDERPGRGGRSRPGPADPPANARRLQPRHPARRYLGRNWPPGRRSRRSDT